MKRFIIPIILILFIVQSSLLNATNPISPNWNERVEWTENKTSKKIPIVEKVSHLVKKKIAKIASSKTIKNLGITSLIIGLASLIALFAGLWVAPWMFILAFILAIIGDIFSIRTLLKSREDKESNRSARTMAWFGLIASLLTGLLPLALFITILIIGF